nr:MAG TPA: hypothetical protein [Caudoviricetes sp.]
MKIYYPKLFTSSSALRWSLASLTSIIWSISSFFVYGYSNIIVLYNQ